MRTKNVYGFGVCLPISVVDIMDADRGDIPRSKYLLRILEHYDKINKPLSFQVERPVKTEAIMPTPMKESTDNGTE